MKIMKREKINDLLKKGLLEIGKGTIIDDDVWLCHYERGGIVKKTIIGNNCIIRSGSVIYSNVRIGNYVNMGHHVVIREGCNIGNDTSIGTGVKVECYTNIGNYVSVETQTHITGWMTIEDYVFVGGFVGSTNDLQMKYRRKGHGEDLKGPTLKCGCRVGSGALLLPGVIIGKYSVINAGEVVRKSVPDYHLMFTRKSKVVYKKIPSKGENEILISK